LGFVTFHTALRRTPRHVVLPFEALLPVCSGPGQMANHLSAGLTSPNGSPRQFTVSLAPSSLSSSDSTSSRRIRSLHPGCSPLVSSFATLSCRQRPHRARAAKLQPPNTPELHRPEDGAASPRQPPHRLPTRRPPHSPETEVCKPRMMTARSGARVTAAERTGAAVSPQLPWTSRLSSTHRAVTRSMLPWIRARCSLGLVRIPLAGFLRIHLCGSREAHRVQPTYAGVPTTGPVERQRSPRGPSQTPSVCSVQGRSRDPDRHLWRLLWRGWVTPSTTPARLPALAAVSGALSVRPPGSGKARHRR